MRFNYVKVFPGFVLLRFLKQFTWNVFNDHFPINGLRPCLVFKSPWGMGQIDTKNVIEKIKPANRSQKGLLWAPLCGSKVFLGSFIFPSVLHPTDLNSKCVLNLTTGSPVILMYLGFYTAYFWLLNNTPRTPNTKYGTAIFPNICFSTSMHD